MFNIIVLPNNYFSAMTSGFPILPRKTVLVKTNLNGSTLFQKEYGAINEIMSPYSFIETSDGNFNVGCYGYNSITQAFFLFLLKVNLNGDSLSSKYINSPPGFNYFGNYIIETSDKGFLITGEIADSSSPQPNDGDLLILKTDSLGNELWHKTFGGPKFDAGFSSIELSDKCFLSIGWTRSFGFGNSTNRDYYLV